MVARSPPAGTPDSPARGRNRRYVTSKPAGQKAGQAQEGRGLSVFQPSAHPPRRALTVEMRPRVSAGPSERLCTDPAPVAAAAKSSA